MDMDWRSTTTSGTQHPASQYHHHPHHHHSALSAVDTIDLQNFDESANVDLQQLFPSAALGGGGVTAPMTANSFHQHLHAPQLPHSTLYFYTPPPPQSATSSEFFGEAFPTFHTDTLPPAWSSAPTSVAGVGSSAATALHDSSYSDNSADRGSSEGVVGATLAVGAGGGNSLPTAIASPKFSTDRRKLCCVEGCKSQARAFNRCKRHGGSKRCSHPGCTKSVQSRGLCIRHGGGSRCQESGCTRAAQSHGRCKMHGGGRPCIVADCEKKAHLKRLCRKHGGGAKCSLPGCDKWAQRQGMCMTHSKHGGAVDGAAAPAAAAAAAAAAARDTEEL